MLVGGPWVELEACGWSARGVGGSCGGREARESGVVEVSEGVRCGGGERGVRCSGDEAGEECDVAVANEGAGGAGGAGNSGNTRRVSDGLCVGT